jgi:hypothetical protein
MFRSFLLRMTLILSTTATISLLLMAATLGIQGLTDGMIFCLMLFALVLIWLAVNYIVVRKTDPEISVEVARLLFPGGAILSILLSLWLAMILDGMIPGSEGKQHYIVLFVGLGIAFFLMVRCFDIKWLRGEAEIVSLEERSR